MSSKPSDEAHKICQHEDTREDMTLRMLKLPHEVKLLATLQLAQDLLQIKFNQCFINRIFKLKFERYFEAKFRRLFSEGFI